MYTENVNIIFYMIIISPCVLDNTLFLVHKCVQSGKLALFMATNAPTHVNFSAYVVTECMVWRVYICTCVDMFVNILSLCANCAHRPQYLLR